MGTPVFLFPNSGAPSPSGKYPSQPADVSISGDPNQLVNNFASLVAMHDAIATSNVLASTNTQGSTQGVPPTLSIKRPWLEEPEGALSFDYQAGVTLPAVGAASTTNLTSATGAAAVLNSDGPFIVPNGYDGVINQLSCNFNGAAFQDFSGDITWILFADSKPVNYYNNIVAQKGTVAQPRKISPLRLYSGVTYTWVVIHNSNGALNGQVVCTMTGYTYPNRG